MNPKTSLKSELEAARTDFGIKFKVVPSKGVPTTPFPITISFSIEQPDREDCFVYDVLSLYIDIIISSFEPPEMHVHVDKIANGFPSLLATEITRLINIHISQTRSPYPNGDGSPFRGWELANLCKWIDLQYPKLVHSVPSCLETYQGTSSAGASIRRFALTSEEVEGPLSGSEYEEDSAGEQEELDEETSSNAQSMLEMRIEQDTKAAMERARLAEIKRIEFEKDPTMHAKPVIISKAEQAELKAAKNKQGVRLRKTGARRKKYEGPGAASK